MSPVYEILDTFNYPHWHDKGLCRDSKYNNDWWIPVSPQARDQAIAICKECPVRTTCLDWILSIEQMEQKTSIGIFGGLTEKQRRRIKRCYLKGCKNRPLDKESNFCSEEHRKTHARLIAHRRNN